MANDNDPGGGFTFWHLVAIIAIACIVGMSVSYCTGSTKSSAEIEHERHEEEVTEFGKNLLTDGTPEREWYEKEYLNK